MSKNHTAETKRKEAALASLYEEHYDKIARYIFVRIGNQTEAEDLAGEVFLRALKSLDSYKERGGGMQAWLFKIAHNLVVDHLRKMSKRKAIPLDAIEVPDRVSLEEMVETRWQIRKLREALEHLTPAQREVIGLRFLAGLPSAEVAKILGKNSGAVREMQRAAVALLRNLMY